jgi:hypothetical protein
MKSVKVGAAVDPKVLAMSEFPFSQCAEKIEGWIWQRGKHSTGGMTRKFGIFKNRTDLRSPSSSAV